MREVQDPPKRLVVVGQAPPRGAPKGSRALDGASGDLLAHLAGLRGRAQVRAIVDSENVLAVLGLRMDKVTSYGRARGKRLRTKLRGRATLLLGPPCAHWFGVDPYPFFVWRRVRGLVYAVVPYPSGLNRAWRDPAIVEHGRRFIREALELVPAVDGLAPSPMPALWRRMLADGVA